MLRALGGLVFGGLFGGLATPAQAQVSRFTGTVAYALVPTSSRAPLVPAGGPGGSGPAVFETLSGSGFLCLAGFGYDAPLVALGAEQSLGVSLNAALGLMLVPTTLRNTLENPLLLDLPQYAVYRLGAKSGKKSQQDYGLGLGLGYRFCLYTTPFESPSVMVEGVRATAYTDWFVRLSADLRTSESAVGTAGAETVKLRQFALTFGRSL